MKTQRKVIWEKTVFDLFEKIKTQFARVIAGSIVFVCIIFFESKYIGDDIQVYKNNNVTFSFFMF